MFIEENGKAKRKVSNPAKEDVNFLLDFYKTTGKFPLFTQVLLETRTDCNMNCKFCPQHHSKRPLTELKWEVFTKIIDELCLINFAGRIAFFMTNEPLLDDRLFEMIDYARKKSPRFFLDITTNGRLLTLEKLDKLFALGLDNININDYRGDRDKTITKVSKNLEEIYEIYTYNPKMTFNYRNTKETLSNYAGVISKYNIADELGFCNYPFRKIAISAGGNVILCCNDYHYTTSFGTVLEKDLITIWQSEEFNEYRFNLLHHKREGLCKNCDEKQNYSVF